MINKHLCNIDFQKLEMLEIPNFLFLATKNSEVIWLSNCLALSLSDEGYHRNVSCALSLISTFLLPPKQGYFCPCRQCPYQYRICMLYHTGIDCLVNETDIDTSLDNPTYTPTTSMFFRHFNQRWRNGSSLYCIRKLDECLYRQSYCWVCQVLDEFSFQINTLSNSGQNSAFELL